MLRRITCATCPPPMEKPSPSPLATSTSSSGIGQLDALGDGQRAAVDGVETVRRGVAGDAARAADARDERDLVRRPADGASARVMAVTTPKSPQPGHQMGLRSLLKSPAWNLDLRNGFEGGHVRLSLWKVLGSVSVLVEVRVGAVALDGGDQLPQVREHFGRLNRVGAALGQRLDQCRASPRTCAPGGRAAPGRIAR